ncbi:PaaI family thioesterase [Agrilactobacillus yilanensis]|uniref:PaaI family thioesterase n=1 Tax=Agrilactobacillus yilanensis TaxID=2485997 RepID=A0ABW4J6H7_9LACO|nr:PaaI family thioesterase [Agrilactobacillus yilanensis]
MDLLEALDIQVTEVTEARTLITLPISDKTKQPFGILHGGLNCVLAETAASLAANAYLGKTKRVAVGLDIQTHHLAAVSTGVLIAEATPIRLGQQILVYQVCTYLAGTSKQTSLSTVTLMAKTFSKEEH